MADSQIFVNHVQECLAQFIQDSKHELDELTIEINPEQLLTVARILKDDPSLRFELLVDICGVDYATYGIGEWKTQNATHSGFERAVDEDQQQRLFAWDKSRFAVVYHLLSLVHNQRLRLRTFTQEDFPLLDSVIDIWPSANWYEREAFDLFGIAFNGHPDLRRILTDYGFIGHPFRKDFPLIGNLEVRYDAAQQRVVYEPVSILPRVLSPKVVRQDNRYNATGLEGNTDGRNT